MLYTSALTYIRDRSHVYNFLPERGFPFYQGTPVMRDDEYVDGEWLRSTQANRVWTLGADGHMGNVPMPKGWKLLGEERYREWFARLTLKLFERTEQYESLTPN
ncbi:MAG: hypothetical protein R3C59_28755 [Planctomycetaceae bacterium]